MRVLVVDLAKGVPTGGSTHRTMSLTSHLLHAGVDVRWLILRAGAEERAFCSTYSIPSDRVTWVGRLSRRFQVMSPRGGIGQMVAQADVVCLSTFLWGAAPLAWFHARQQGVPWVVSPHGSLPYFGRSLALKWIAHGLIGRSIVRGAAAVIAVSDAEREALTAWVGPRPRLEIIPNGVDEPDDSDAGTMTNTPPLDGAPYTLYLGRLSAEKGVDLLIRAFGAVPRALRGHLKLVVAGDGPGRPQLEALVQQLDLAGHVTFPGWAAGPKKQALLRGAEFVTIPSTRDAMTLVALEAGAAGRPVLISRACGFPEAALCGGAISADPTLEGIRAGLQHMLERRHEWAAMGRALRTLVTQQYLWRHQGARFGALLETVAR